MTELSVSLSPEALELLAVKVAEIITVSDQPPPVSPYLSVAEAADYIRAKPQRIYDLLSAGRLERYKDGSRVLVSRAELDAYLERRVC
jgi:excisionase family DNA binding protein